MATNHSRSKITSVIADAFLGGVGLALIWAFGGETSTYTPDPISPSLPEQAEAPSIEELPKADFILVSNEVMNLEAAALPRDRPVTLALSLPVASANAP